MGVPEEVARMADYWDPQERHRLLAVDEGDNRRAALGGEARKGPLARHIQEAPLNGRLQ
jgi:hypothetical protein